MANRRVHPLRVFHHDPHRAQHHLTDDEGNELCDVKATTARVTTTLPMGLMRAQPSLVLPSARNVCTNPTLHEYGLDEPLRARGLPQNLRIWVQGKNQGRIS